MSESAWWETWGLGHKYSPTWCVYLADTFHIDCVPSEMDAAADAHRRGDIDLFVPYTYDSDDYPKLIDYFEEGPLVCGECFEG